MSDSIKNLYTKQAQLTNELRSNLDKWEANPTSSELKERCAKIEADIDTVETQLRSAKKIEALDIENNKPAFDTRGLVTAGSVSDDLNRRFVKAIREGNNEELRTMSVGSAGGAAAVPNDWDQVIRQKMFANNVIGGLAKRTFIDGQKQITLENGLPTTTLTAEGASIAASDATFGSLLQIFPYAFRTKVAMTNQFLADALSGNGGVGNVISYVAEKVGVSQGRSWEDYFANGTGSSQPQGVGSPITGAGEVEVAVNTAISAITADNLIDTFFALAPQYRANASWVMSDALLKTIRKLKDSNGQYLFQLNGSMTEAPNGTLLGRPIHVSPFWNTAVTANKTYATFGDFSFFEVFERQGLDTLTDPYVDAATGKTNLYVTSRMDSKVIHAEAFAQLNTAAA